MKIHYTIISTFLCIALIAGCSDDKGLTELIEHCQTNQAEFTLEYLNRNNTGQNLKQLTNKQLKRFASVSRDKGYNFDEALFLKLLEKEKLSEMENKKLQEKLDYLGFDNLESYAEYTSLAFSLGKTISAETNYHELDEKYRIQILEDFFYNYEASEKSGDVCLIAFNACINKAHADYTASVVACTISAISIAKLTFGIGGILMQVACCSVSLYAFNMDLDVCSSNYYGCIE